jgi:uncharacterized protein YkwD
MIDWNVDGVMWLFSKPQSRSGPQIITPAPHTPAPPPPVSQSTTDALPYDKTVLDLQYLHNMIRAQSGCPPLRLNVALCAAAQVHAKWMALNRNMSHQERPGTPGFLDVDFFDRAWSLKYPFGGGGENIAAGQTDAASVVNSWVNSPPHLENIVNPQYVDVGFGVEQDDYGNRYWCAVFAYPNQVAERMKIRAWKYVCHAPEAIVMQSKIPEISSPRNILPFAVVTKPGPFPSGSA